MLCNFNVDSKEETDAERKATLLKLAAQAAENKKDEEDEKVEIIKITLGGFQ